MLKTGDHVYHRNLQLKGTVVDSAFLGPDKGFTIFVEFEDGDTREVSISWLEVIESKENKNA